MARKHGARAAAGFTGEVNIRDRIPIDKSGRPLSRRVYGVFIGQHMLGKWSTDKAAVEAEAESVRKNFRPCMCCARPFLSQGHHNRLCADCGRRDSGIM